MTVTQICEDVDEPMKTLENTLKVYLQRDVWSNLLLSNATGDKRNKIPWHGIRPLVKQKYPALLGLIPLDSAMLAQMSPGDVDKVLAQVFQVNAKAALKHVRDSLRRRSCGYSGSVDTKGSLVWSTNAKRAEALQAVGALMRDSGMVVDWEKPATWQPYVRAFESLDEEDYNAVELCIADGNELTFGLRNAIEEELSVALTQKDDWNTEEDVDDRLLCEYLLQNHDATECRSDTWRELHGCYEGGGMSYIPGAKTNWFYAGKEPVPEPQSEWLQQMWMSPSTEADFWVSRFLRLGVDAQTREANGWDKICSSGIMHTSFHAFLGIQAASKRILADMYADRLALLILAARHGSPCALSTHFPALRYEGCKPFIKLIASFLTKPLPVVDGDAMAKAKFFDEVDAGAHVTPTKEDWDAGCQTSVVHGAKTFIQALIKKDSSSISLDITTLLRPLLTPLVVELHLNCLKFLSDKHLDETIFATDQHWPNLLTLDLSRTCASADHVITRVCGPLAVGGAAQTPAADLPFPNLVRLNLNYLSGVVSVVGMRQLGATTLASLVHLHLSGLGVTGFGLREMCSRAPNRFLTLDLSSSGALDITCIAETQKNIQHLMLSHSCVNAVCVCESVCVCVRERERERERVCVCESQCL